MIYAAALCKDVLNYNDFIEVIGHNLEYTRDVLHYQIWCEDFVMPDPVLKGKVWPLTLFRAEPTVPMVWNDFTFATIFSRSTSPIDQSDRIMLPLLQQNENSGRWLELFLRELYLSNTDRPVMTIEELKKQVEFYQIQNGNVVTVMHDIRSTKWLESKFGF